MLTEVSKDTWTSNSDTRLKLELFTSMKNQVGGDTIYLVVICRRLTL